MQTSNYPDIHIRSKNELAKRIVGIGISQEIAHDLINDVLAHYADYWRDNTKRSEPAKDKWVRDASRTKLGELLEYINERVLAAYDTQLPGFIFGGVQGKNHVLAARYLQGRRRKRILLKLDISRFFEQNHVEQVERILASRCGCGAVGAKLIANLCCVPTGAKTTPSRARTIARGFATSSRLAVWCNLDAFIKLQHLVRRELRGKEPRIAIYVDDIGITASGATVQDMVVLYPKIKALLLGEKHQPLPLNDKKTKIILHSGDTFDVDGNYQGRFSYEILGIQMRRSSLTPGSKSRWKLADTRQKLNNGQRANKHLRNAKKSQMRYKRYVEQPHT